MNQLFVFILFISSFGAWAQSLSVGAPELVLAGEDAPSLLYHHDIVRNGCDREDCKFTADASFATLRKRDGSVALWNVAYSQVLLFEGARVADAKATQGLGRLAKEAPAVEWFAPPWTGKKASNTDLQKRPDAYLAWLPNLYQIDEDELLGFVHIEDWTPCNSLEDGGHLCTNYPVYRIGLAYSADTGHHWQWLGDVVQPYFNANQFTNIGGIPYTIIDGYIHVYFNETLCSVVKLQAQGDFDRDAQGNFQLDGRCPWNANRYVSVVRAPLQATIDAARKGSLAAWRKYWQGQWSEAGVGGRASNLNMPTPGNRAGYYDAHGDGAYCKPLDRHMLLLNWYPDDGQGTGTYALFSKDGLHWEKPQLVLAADARHARQYATLIGIQDSISNNDFSVLGREFWVLYPDMHKNPAGEPQMFQTDEHGNTLYVQRKIPRGQNAGKDFFSRIPTDIMRVRVRGE